MKTLIVKDFTIVEPFPTNKVFLILNNAYKEFNERAAIRVVKKERKFFNKRNKK